MKRLLSFIFTLGLLSGCTTSGPIGSDGTISGLTTRDEGVTATTADLVVVWGVTSGSPDYDFISGAGSLTSAGFDLDLPITLEAEAQNSYGLGVGIIAAFEPETAPAQGRIPDDLELPEAILGATPRHAIIYRDPAATELLEWGNAFPNGFSCGVGVAAPDGESFDTFEPIDCDMIELRLGNVDEFDFVNWT